MRYRYVFQVFVLLGLGLCVSLPSALGSSEEDHLRISISDLKQRLGSPSLIVVDVRDPISWSKSDLKIRGAVRVDPDKVYDWGESIPKDKEILFYCA